MNIKINDYDFSFSNLLFDSHNSVKSDYFMYLEIPSINLKRGIYDKSDSRNNIEKNVSILNESLMPNEGCVILAAHSGNSSVSYFNSLNRLSIGDSVFLFYNDVKYHYIVESMDVYLKSGLKFRTDLSLKKIILVTCLDDYNYLIITAFLST